MRAGSCPATAPLALALHHDPPQLLRNPLHAPRPRRSLGLLTRSLRTFPAIGRGRGRVRAFPIGRNSSRAALVELLALYSDDLSARTTSERCDAAQRPRRDPHRGAGPHALLCSRNQSGARPGRWAIRWLSVPCRQLCFTHPSPGRRRPALACPPVSETVTPLCAQVLLPVGEAPEAVFQRYASLIVQHRQVGAALGAERSMSGVAPCCCRAAAAASCSGRALPPPNRHSSN